MRNYIIKVQRQLYRMPRDKRIYARVVAFHKTRVFFSLSRCYRDAIAMRIFGER